MLILECATGKDAADIAAAPSRTASMDASYLSSEVNVPDSDLARRVAKYLMNMDLALDHIDASAGPWPDFNACSLVNVALGAMQIRPNEVLTSSDMLSKLMDIHADAQAPRDGTSTIASRKAGRGKLSAEAKVTGEGGRSGFWT